MVLRSGCIIPFQFRDHKKLLMIGVPEENRNLSIWDLKNVVRAAFGVYNFEFRNKKIGFIIPDELLLNYLAQRHDLTNFVIEVGQVYEPNKDTYPPESSCNICHCVTKKPLDIQETTNISSHLSQMTNLSAINSQNSENAESADEQPPPLKLRAAHSHNPTVITTPNHTTDADHLVDEAKFNFAAGLPPTTDIDDAEDSQPSSKSYAGITDEEQQQQLHQQQQQHHEFERWNEYIMHQHQQQQQQQQHQQQVEALMHETSSNNLRQRKERMSKKQKEVYVNFLEQNPIINDRRRNDPFLDPFWIKLADILNSVPQGAVKHVAEWKQTFDNWRYRIFLYARFNSKLAGDATLDSRNFKPLTQTDKRAYSIWIRNPDTAPPDLEKMRNVFINLEDTQQE